MYNGIPELNFKETYEFLKNSIKILKNKTYFISGSTGIGKSEIIKKIANEMDAILIDRRLANIMPEDISGIPVKNDRTNSVDFTPIDTMSILFDENIKKPIFLFLDEMNLSSQEVLKAVFELVYDRTINGKPINPNTYIFAAGNLGDEYLVEEFSPALKRRLNYIEMIPDFKDWKDFAKNEVPDFILKFLENNTLMFSLVKDDIVYSPAQWFEMGVAVDKAIKNNMDENFILNLMKSFIGEKALDVYKYFYYSYTLKEIKQQNIDYSKLEKDTLKNIFEEFLSSVRTGNLDFYLQNKKFVADFMLHINDSQYYNEFVNTIGIENLDELPEDYQEKLLKYVS